MALDIYVLWLSLIVINNGHGYGHGYDYGYGYSYGYSYVYGFDYGYDLWLWLRLWLWLSKCIFVLGLVKTIVSCICL